MFKTLFVDAIVAVAAVTDENTNETYIDISQTLRHTKDLFDLYGYREWPN